MGCASIMTNPGVSDISENLKASNSDDKIRRAERRWKRRERNRIGSLQRKCCASATRITVKSRGNKSVVTDNEGHMVEDEVDEEHKMFLDTYVSHIDVDRDKHADGSDIDAISGYNNDSDNDSDPQYKMFLKNLRQEGKIYVSSVIVGNQLVHVRYEEEEEEEEEETGSPVESLQSQETERGPCSKRPHSEVSSVPKNNCNSELEPDTVDEDYQIFLNSCRVRKSSSIRQNSQISDQAIDTPAVQCDIDQDYQIFSNSEVSSVPKNNCNSELEPDAVDEDYQIFLNSCRGRKSSSVRQNSQISDQAINTPAVQCDIDQDYHTFLNSCWIAGGRKSLSVRQNSQISDQAINTPAVQCDIDQDYHAFLNSCRIDAGRKSSSVRNSQISDQAINTPAVQCDIDQDYHTFLNSCWIDGGRKSSSVRQNSQISDQAINTPAVQCDIDQDYHTFLSSCGIDAGRKSSSVRENSQISDQAINTPAVQCDIDQDYHTFLNSCWINGGRRSSCVRQNSQISDQAINTPAVRCDINRGYQLFQNSARIIGGNPVYMRDRNITKEYNVEGGSNSSDSDLILLEPHQICENTPFSSSKTYDSSWFENETNPRDSRIFPAYDHSEFRRRLMEYLEKPYNQKECDEYMQEVHRRTHKDRHFETRQGVVKSYPAYGVNKSYLELYPDVAKAIAEFKEPRRVLFLLRGFFFWLQNLTHDGIFRPWLDESCLEILRKNVNMEMECC